MPGRPTSSRDANHHDEAERFSDRGSELLLVWWQGPDAAHDHAQQALAGALARDRDASAAALIASEQARLLLTESSF